MMVQKTYSTTNLMISMIILLLVNSSKAHFDTDLCGSSSECAARLKTGYECFGSLCTAPEISFDKETGQRETLVKLGVIALLAVMTGTDVGIFVLPTLLFTMNYAFSDAVPYGSAIVVGAAAVQVLLSLFQINRERKNSLLIDFRLASILVPRAIAGTQLGLLVAESVSLPPFWAEAFMYLIVGSMVVIKWIFTAIKEKQELKVANEIAGHQAVLGEDRSINRGRQGRGNTAQQSNHADRLDTGARSSSDHNSSEGGSANRSKYELRSKKNRESWDSATKGKPIANLLKTSEQKQNPPRGTNLREESMEVTRSNEQVTQAQRSEVVNTKSISTLICEQLFNISIIIVSLGVIILGQMSRGSKVRKSIAGFEVCSNQSKAVMLCAHAFCLILSVFAHRKNMRAIDEQLNHEDNRIFKRSALLVLGYFSGFLSGSIGAAGSFLTIPLAMSAGLGHGAAISLSVLTSLFTGISTVAQYWLGGGAVSWDSIRSLIGLGAIAGFLGSIILFGSLRSGWLNKTFLTIALIIMVYGTYLMGAEVVTETNLGKLLLTLKPLC